jgi:anti-anti-sigma factor
MTEDPILADLDSTKIGTSRVGGNAVLSLKESLTFENCDEFEGMLNRVIEQNPTGIILDLKAVGVLDSAALEMLIRIHEAMKGQGNPLKLTHLNAVCRDILIVTRLTNFFHVFDDIAEAVRG